MNESSNGSSISIFGGYDRNSVLFVVCLAWLVWCVSCMCCVFVCVLCVVRTVYGRCGSFFLQISTFFLNKMPHRPFRMAIIFQKIPHFFEKYGIAWQHSLFFFQHLPAFTCNFHKNALHLCKKYGIFDDKRWNCNEFCRYATFPARNTNGYIIIHPQYYYLLE